MVSPYDFAYSVALVRTLEALLLNNNEVERMVLAKNAQESFKILNELDYANNTAEITDIANFQEVINSGLLENKEILKKVCPDNNVLNILWLQYDFHNIKTCLKAKLSNKTFEEISPLLNKMGTIPFESLHLFIFENSPAQFNLPKHTEDYIKKKIQKAPILFEKEGKNPQVIDLYLDQKLMKIIFGIATDTQDPFLINYIKILIDLNNISLFFRMKVQNKDLSLYEIAFLWNGNIGFAKFQEAYKHALSSFPEIMKTTQYANIVETGFKHFEDEKTFIFLEREIENYLVSYIKKAKLSPFGPGPLVAYFLATKNNALIIRMIMVNKLNEIDPEEIKTRLRNLYA